MKKILLGTTALSIFAASSAVAAPNVTIGGFIDFQAGIADQDSSYETVTSGTTTTAHRTSQDINFQNDTEVHVRVNGKTDNGLGYGAVIELEADVTADADNQGLNADKTYVFVESNFGRVELGSNTSASAALKVDASTFARATGGIAGDWYDFVNVSTLRSGTTSVSPVSGTVYLDTPGLLTEAAKSVTEDANKITYYSPRFSGVQVGLSYTPDLGNVGTATGFSGDAGVAAAATNSYEQVINAGINYVGQYDQVGVTASLTGEWASDESASTSTTRAQDISGWAFGLNLNFAGFTVGGSWADLDDSGRAVSTTTTGDSKYWTLGGAYSFGPGAVSVTYLDSELANNELTNLSIGADYQLAPGLVPYIEVSFFETDDNVAGNTDNDGSVVLIGTELSF